MAGQNINQYVYPNLNPKLSLESYDMSLTSDEKGFNMEVVFSPYLIAQTYGNRLPFYFDINSPITNQLFTLNYKRYNINNIFVSQNYYNINEEDLSCFSAQTSCDIGLTGIDNGLVTGMTGQSITFTKGLFPDDLKFQRLYFDRRLKLFQVTANTSSPNVRFSGFPNTVLYEVVSKYGTTEGLYHELYGGFYQGFYRLFGYDYDIFPERVNKGWTVELLLKPRLINEYFPGPGETTLNLLYPENQNTFFYFGSRAENKFYHHADGSPNCLTGYTRFTSPLTGISTCACCNRAVTNSRCIYVYPPRSKNGVHDTHVNYSCDKCGGDKMTQVSCGCGCNEIACATCGWECQIHECSTVVEVSTNDSETPIYDIIPNDISAFIPTCISECDILINSSTGQVYVYDLSANTTTLIDVFPNATDIAHTQNKMFLSVGSLVKEYDITLCPFSITFNRDVGVTAGAGLFAVDDVTLVGSASRRILQYDISVSPVTFFDIAQLDIGRAVAGDMVITTDGKLLVLTFGGGNTYLEQYALNPGGPFPTSPEVEINLTAEAPLLTNPFGLVEVSGVVYIINVNGNVYSASTDYPYGITLIADIPDNISVNGASQIQSCLNTDINLPSPTPTPTNTTTPTPTNSVTPTPTTTPYPPENAFFIDCCPSNNSFQIFNLPNSIFIGLVNNNVYYITNSSYTGCATFTTSITTAPNNYNYEVSDTITLQTDCTTCLVDNSILCPTPTPTPTSTPTPTPTATYTQTPTQTSTQTQTQTPASSQTPTRTQTQTQPPTQTPTRTTTPTPSYIINNCVLPPVCTPSCKTCTDCTDCDTCSYTGFSSIENTCETDPKMDILSNNISFRLCGDPKNPGIGIRAIKFTGGCETTGTCNNSGITYTTGYTILDYCTPPIYDYCKNINYSFIEMEHWFQLDVVWERYTWLDTCDLWYRGGLGDITKKVYLESLANNTVSLINTPHTRVNPNSTLQVDIVNLNEKWLLDEKYRKGRLKIYVNGQIFYTIEDFEEIIPRALNTDKEKQVGVPFNISWGGGTQGLRENLTFNPKPACDIVYGVEIDLSLLIIVIPGSINIQYILTTEYPIPQETKVNFKHLLGKVSGGFFTVDVNITIPPNGFSGQTFVTLDENYDDLNEVSQVEVETILPLNFRNNFSVTSQTLFPGPTPTPTSEPTPTPTPTNEPTPTPTPTNTETPTPTPTNTETPTPTPTQTPEPEQVIDDAIITNNTEYINVGGNLYLKFIDPLVLEDPILTDDDNFILVGDSLYMKYIDPSPVPEPSPTQTPTVTPTPSITPSITPSQTETPTPTNTETPTPTPTTPPTNYWQVTNCNFALTIVVDFGGFVPTQNKTYNITFTNYFPPNNWDCWSVDSQSMDSPSTVVSTINSGPHDDCPSCPI